MKVHYSTRFFLHHLNPHSTQRMRVLRFSTKTLTPSSSNSLTKRVFSAFLNPNVSVLPILDQWVEEGNSVTEEDLRLLVQKMKGFKRFRHALEISHWMTDRRFFKLSPTDVAIRLNMIYELRGIEHAEKYFGTISKQLKKYQVYNTFMNCYVQEKSVKKAEAIMQEIERLGFATSFSYNVLVNLYAQTGQHEKIDNVMSQMKQKGIPQDNYTLVNLLNACVVAFDIGGMENILKQMEADPDILVEWDVYALAASGYIKVGSIDKASSLLKKIEKMPIRTRRDEVLSYLLTLYGNAGLKDDLYRVWNVYISKGRVLNISYCSMISALAKVDDMDGAEEIYRKWESSGSSYNFRILNRLISGFSKKGLLEKAEALVHEALEKAAKSGKEPYGCTWRILATGYLEQKQMPKVVEMTKKELSVGRESWKPSPVIVDSCLEYFEKQRDFEGVEELVKMLKPFGPLTEEIYHRLLRLYTAEGKPVSDVYGLMKAHGVSANEETEKIL